MSPLAGAAPEDQLPPAFQSLLTAPVQVSAVAGPPLPAATATGMLPVVSTPAWSHRSKEMLSDPAVAAAV